MRNVFVSIFSLTVILVLFQNCGNQVEFGNKVADSLSAVSNIPIEAIPYCQDIKAPAMQPSLNYHWSESSVASEYKQIMSSPVVGDLDGDGIPEIVFTTFASDKYNGSGVIRVLDGATKVEKLVLDNEDLRSYGSVSPLLIDVDGKGQAEIVYVNKSLNEVIAVTHSGQVLARYKHPTSLAVRSCHEGLSAADLNRDGLAEIIIEGMVLSYQANGEFKAIQIGDGTIGTCGSFAIQLDDSGDDMQIINQFGAYDYNSQDNTVTKRFDYLRWGYVASADIIPEIPGREVVVTGSGYFSIYDSQGNVITDKNLKEHLPSDICVKRGADVIGGGQATLGDFDGDTSTVEIAVATGKSLSIFDSLGNKLAGSRTTDCSSLKTGVTSFDFNGDSRPEIIYSDERSLRMYSMTSSDNLEIIWEVTNTTGTLSEYPIVVDVNGDYSSELVVVSNNYGSIADIEGSTNGVRIFSASEGNWMPTRSIWNQHAYNVMNVDENLRPATSIRAPGSYVEKNFKRNLPYALEELSCREK